MDANRRESLRRMIFSPSAAARALQTYQDCRAGFPGWSFGMPTIDAIVTPFQPAELIVYQAQTSQGKTSLLAWTARREAERIQRGEVQLSDGEPCVVYYTLEETIERMEMRFVTRPGLSLTEIVRGTGSPSLFSERLRERLHLPIYTVGHSFGGRGPQRLLMTYETMQDSLEVLWEDMGLRPTLVCLDYIQLVPVEGAHGGTRAEELAWLAQALIGLGATYGATIVINAQSRVGSWDLPGVMDTQWSSGIAQAADKVFSLATPSRWDSFLSGDKTTIRVAGRDWQITPELVLLGLRKQRNGPAPHVWVMRFDFSTMTLGIMTDTSDVSILGHEKGTW